ncbi:MAG TPA: serine/threonine-protein kinase [Burkholderiaceae bacterium]|nr:serine/threonine-protein kinase [Burkholderiaceae bacterium]
MKSETQLLALLVHRRQIDEASARAAMASGAIRDWLVGHGVCTAEQWAAWQRTDGGTRPALTRYELGPLLGEGGTARVFSAVDRTDGRKVCLKVLRAELATDPAQGESFVREAKLLIELSHPHLVKGYRVAREGATIFFAMEELPGRSLQEELAARGRFDETTALRIVLQVAAALDALHARGLVHRDVKPGNVLWSEPRGAVLIDLGFAVPRAKSAAGGGDTTAGTVHYIAPEQARGSGELDVRADIYALGATLYQLVTGSLPFEGHSSEEVLRKQVLESLSGERIRDLQLSPQVHYFIEKMMAKEREIRFQDPQQLQQEIAAFLQAQESQRELEQKAQQGRPRLGHRRPRPER